MLKLIKPGHGWTGVVPSNLKPHLGAREGSESPNFVKFVQEDHNPCWISSN